MAHLELKRQLFEAKQEALQWKQRCREVSLEKAEQLKHIETSLMLLEEKLRHERKEIQKRLTEQEKKLQEQQNTIEKLTSTNQKLLAAMMVMRYKKPFKYSCANPKNGIRESTASVTPFNLKEDPSIEKQIKTGQITINGSNLIACRAKAYAAEQQIERSTSERSPRESFPNLTRKKHQAHRSHSLPQGTRTIML